MTRRVVGGAAGTSAVVTQNNSSYVLIAETSTSGGINPFSGMTNPILADGTNVVDFDNIPQTYRDLRIVFDNFGHNTSNSSAYRIQFYLNNNTTNQRYYTRAENRDTTWNADNVNYLYFGYVYRPENVTWVGQGEIIIPGYSKNRGGWNNRQFYGWWHQMNQSAYMVNYVWDYYNSADADKEITRITFRIDGDPGFRARSKISIYGIGTV